MAGLLQNNKVVIFDFDGTLTYDSINPYVTLLQKIGVPKRLCNKALKNSAKVSSPRRMKIVFSIMSKLFSMGGISKTDIDDVAKNTKLMQGTVECLTELKHLGYKIFIVSDGLLPVIDQVLGSNKKLFDKIYCQNCEFSKTGKLQKIRFNGGKVASVNHIIATTGVKPNDVLYFGNGGNDLCIRTTNIKLCCVNDETKLVDENNMLSWDYNLGYVNDFGDIKTFILNHWQTMTDDKDAKSTEVI